VTEALFLQHVFGAFRNFVVNCLELLGKMQVARVLLELRVYGRALGSQIFSFLFPIRSNGYQDANLTPEV
jgi:hypothetical protein